jgi:hypothetical protein
VPVAGATELAVGWGAGKQLIAAARSISRHRVDLKSIFSGALFFVLMGREGEHARLVLRWFITVWLGLLAVRQLIRAGDIVLRAPSIWTGIWDALDLLSSFNSVHFVVLLLVASPAFGAFMWLERREQRRAQAQHQ